MIALRYAVVISHVPAKNPEQFKSSLALYCDESWLVQAHQFGGSPSSPFPRSKRDLHYLCFPPMYVSLLFANSKQILLNFYLRVHLLFCVLALDITILF